jgi:hypothetical protein
MKLRHGLIAIGFALALSCSSSGRLAPRVEAGAEVQHRFAWIRGPKTGVSLFVEERTWTSNTARILVNHTPLFVAVRNDGSEPVRYRTEDFVLRIGDHEYEAVPLGRLVKHSEPGTVEKRMAVTLGMRGATLEPGGIEDGYLFFRRKLEGKDKLEDFEISLSLFDPGHEEILEAIRIPLVVVE